MAYTKTNWQDLPDTSTPINATNLNKIEDELEYLDAQIISNSDLTSDYTIESNSCFKMQNFVNISINVFNSSGTYSTYTWVKLARLPVGCRPSGERYVSGFGCGSGWSTPTAIPIMVDSDGYINVYTVTSNLKRAIANGIIKL